MLIILSCPSPIKPSFLINHAYICSHPAPQPLDIRYSPLQTLLTLCAIQAQNGSAGDAVTFAPIGYTDSASEANAGAVTGGAERIAIASTGTLQVIVLGLGLVGGLGVWNL
jgi:hypothetical protein